MINVTITVGDVTVEVRTDIGILEQVVREAGGAMNVALRDRRNYVPVPCDHPVPEVRDWVSVTMPESWLGGDGYAWEATATGDPHMVRGTRKAFGD